MKTRLKRMMMAVLLLAFAGAPSLARAGTINTAPAAPPPVVVETTGAPPLGSTTAGAASGETADYAAREAAAPELGKFRGGSVVVITSGTLVLVLVIVLIVILL